MRELVDRPPIMPHQQEGVEFLLRQGSGLIAFEQGLGKTLVVIEAFSELRRRASADVLLVLCPNSLKRNWAVEISRFAPELTVTIIEGAARDRRHLLGTAATDVVVMGYESARNDITSLRALLARGRAVAVRCARGPECGGCLRKARHRRPECPRVCARARHVQGAA